jgi:hypothetical protein
MELSRMFEIDPAPCVRRASLPSARTNSMARAALGLLVSAFVSGGLLIAQTAPAARPEHHVKAAFLLNFTRFVEWSTAADTSEPFHICIYGNDPFGSIIDEIVSEETVSGRKFSVDRLSHNAPQGCQLLFVPGSEPDVPLILAQTGKGTLTVGEGDQFIRNGGMIALVIENRRVRFDVNLRAAQDAGLRISSRLLKVARWVVK